MKKSSKETSTASRTPEKGSLTVSPRKRAANRQNALKSTGPKTASGKAFSQRNSWKHGLFARQFLDFVSHREDPWEYNELQEGLREQFQPCGRAEELEVERIGQCWWKLKRVYRYENATNRVALNFASGELAEQQKCSKKLEENEKAAVQLLENATDEIVSRGEISSELKEKVFAAMPGSDELWEGFEWEAERFMKNHDLFSKIRPDHHEYNALLARATAGFAIREIKALARVRDAYMTEGALAQHLIPSSDTLDKILRYETSIDRSLNRALERLERMQRTRRGANSTDFPE